MDNFDSAIRDHRTANATVTLAHNGSPLANQEVVVEQKRHKFLFGSNWGGSIIPYANGELSGHAKELAERRNQHFLALLNQATLPFYWGRFEPERGKPDTQRILKAAQLVRRSRLRHQRASPLLAHRHSRLAAAPEQRRNPCSAGRAHPPRRSRLCRA